MVAVIIASVVVGLLISYVAIRVIEQGFEG